MSGKKMEGNEEQKRQKAREAREAGEKPSERGETSGASKQRYDASNEEYSETLDSKRRGKQDVISENTPTPKPGYGAGHRRGRPDKDAEEK